MFCTTVTHDAARALTKVAIEQTEAIRKQADAALQSVAVTTSANRIAEEANRLSVEQLKADLRPILVCDFTFDPDQIQTRGTVKNVGRGPAKDVQISIGTAKDELPKNYIGSRTLIGSSDEVSVLVNYGLFKQTGMTIHFTSLDGQRSVTSVYMQEHAIKHDFEELRP